jgi:hypothetical protein
MARPLLVKQSKSESAVGDVRYFLLPPASGRVSRPMAGVPTDPDRGLGPTNVRPMVLTPPWCTTDGNTVPPRKKNGTRVRP